MVQMLGTSPAASLSPNSPRGLLAVLGYVVPVAGSQRGHGVGRTRLWCGYLGDRRPQNRCCRATRPRCYDALEHAQADRQRGCCRRPGARRHGVSGAKSDLDAMWLARLTEMGLLRAGFVPPKAIRDLRDS